MYLYKNKYPLTLAAMTRKEAKQKLAEARLPLLDEEDREGLLLEWAIIDPEEDRFQELPEALRIALLEGEEIEDAAMQRYDPLILLAIEDELVGVRNEYLQQQLAQFKIVVDKIEGEPEKLERCPCCDYLTLTYLGMDEICSVCYWEDEDPESAVSNDLSLEDARANFARIGICDESILEYRLENPELIFLK